MKKTVVGLIAVLGWASLCGAAQVSEVTLTLQDMETQAMDHSPQCKAKVRELDAAKNQTDAQAALLWPRLSMEGKVNYITELPELTIDLPIPHAEPMTFSMGDNLSYSLGLQLGWQAWDGFAVRAGAAALKKAAEAKARELEAIRLSVKLKTRLAYFRTQLASEQVAALVESVRLAQAQNADIQARARVGSASRIDALSSRMDVAERKKQLREARTQLAAAVWELMELAGQAPEQDLTLPLGAGQNSQLPADVAPPTVLLRLDPMEASRNRLEKGEQAFQPDRNANLQTLDWVVRAADDRARSAASGYWPWITVYGKSSLDYPNQVVQEEVWQNTAGASLSWTLWQAGRTGALVRAEEAQKGAGQETRNQLEEDLRLAWRQAQDRVRELNDIQRLNEQQLKDAEALARLVYEAYQSGRVKYLEVQSANLRVLQTKTQKAVTETQTLIQLALLESLQTEEETHEIQK